MVIANRLSKIYTRTGDDGTNQRSQTPKHPHKFIF